MITEVTVFHSEKKTSSSKYPIYLYLMHSTGVFRRLGELFTVNPTSTLQRYKNVVATPFSET